MAFTKNTFTIRWFNIEVKGSHKARKGSGNNIEYVYMCARAFVSSFSHHYGAPTKNQPLCKMLETEWQM